MKCNKHAWFQSLTNSDKQRNEIQTLVINYPSMLHKIPEKWRSRICSSRSLKSCKYKPISICNNKSGYVNSSCILAHCFFSRNSPQWVMASSFKRFLDHTQRRTTVGRTPLDKWSAHRRNLYLTTHNTCNRQTSMPPIGLELTISAGERLQTYALDRTATGTGSCPL
jgi:hypothetical protein